MAGTPEYVMGTTKMSDRIIESISALMDDEADELELHRVRRAMDADAELVDRWRRYHLVSALLQERGAERATTSASVHARRVADAGSTAAVAAGSDDGGPVSLAQARQARTERSATPVNGSSRLQAGAGFAVAAAVTLTVMLALPTTGVDRGVVAGPEIAAVPPSPAQIFSGPVVGALQLQAGVQLGPVAPQNSSPAVPATVGPELGQVADARARDRLAREHLDAYFLHHVEHSALNNSATVLPFVKMAAFSSDD